MFGDFVFFAVADALGRIIGRATDRIVKIVAVQVLARNHCTNYIARTAAVATDAVYQES